MEAYLGAPRRHDVVRGSGVVRLTALGGVDLPLDRVYARTDVTDADA